MMTLMDTSMRFQNYLIQIIYSLGLKIARKKGFDKSLWRSLIEYPGCQTFKLFFFSENRRVRAAILLTVYAVMFREHIDI